MRSRTHRIPNAVRFPVIALALLLVATAMPLSTLAQTAPAVQRMDLPALIANPLDLAKEGIAGYLAEYGVTFLTIDEALTASPFAYSRGTLELSSVPGAGDTLRATGWVQFHEQTYGSTSTDYQGLFNSTWDIGIEQYRTADGAESAFTAFSTDAAIDAGTATLNREPLATAIGDQSIMWRHAGDGTSITLIARVETLILSVSNYEWRAGNSPDPAAVERVMARQIARIQAAAVNGFATLPCLPDETDAKRVELFQAAGQAFAPGTSLCVQRFLDASATQEFARYRFLDGVAIPLDPASPSETISRQKDGTAEGIRHQYESRYVLDGPSGVSRAWVYVTDFVDVASATAYFDDLEARLHRRPVVDQVTVMSIDPAIGDSAATYTWLSTDTDTYVTGSVTRIGTRLIDVRMSQSTAPIPATAETLLTSQVTCMQAGACLTPIAPPHELLQAASGS